MATLGSKLITKEQEWSANLTERDHLGRALLIAPHKMMDKMSTLFSAQNIYSDNPLSSILQGVKGGEVTISGTEWEWDLKGANTRPLVSMENVEPASNTTPGKFKRPFKIKLDENWYKPTDVITPGTSGKKYLCLIVGGPVRHGSGDGWLYTVQLVSKEDKDFLPVKYLKAGQQWVKYFSPSGEAAEKGGSTQFALPISLKNKLSKYRKEYRVTDYASTEVLRVGIPDSLGNYHKSWIRYADVEFMQQWYREKEIARWYARSTDSIMQDNGRPYQMGPGIQEQLEDSHIHRYSKLTTKLIEEYLMDIFYGRVKPGTAGRNVMGFTGEYGMLEFHNAIEDKIGKTGFIRNVEVYTNKINTPLHNNGLEFGMQYVKYNMANGSSLQLIHNPLYDNREIHTEIDEITGKPVESMRFTFLDFSGDKGKSNIKVVKKEGGDFFNYVCGNYGPYGPSQSAGKAGMSAHAGDYYEMHIGCHEGINIEDVTKCGELIFARN